MTQAARYAGDFARLQDAFCGADRPWMRRLREASIERFVRSGFPSRAMEEWRHTDLAGVERACFEQPTAPRALDPRQVEGLALVQMHGCRLVFIDGHLAADLSHSECGTSLAANLDAAEAHLGRLAAEPDAFGALNTAFFRDGALIVLPRGARRPDPVHLLFVSTEGRQSHPRVLIVAEPGAEARIVEEYVGLGAAPALTCAVTEILVGEDAHLDHTKLLREPVGAFHLATVAVKQERHSRFESHSIVLGAGRSRNDIRVRLDAEGAECSLDGLYMVRGDQLVDHHTTIDHAGPRATSRQLYKGILADRARGVFNGRVVVRPNAQKTDADQSNKNLLLSNDALVHSNPQLEIRANDVRCKHGSSIGQLSADELFYLRSRGIGERQARKMLVSAFGEEMIDRLSIDPIRAALACAMAVHAA
jgi:Fe-S cluster assembly protein SufD